MEPWYASSGWWAVFVAGAVALLGGAARVGIWLERRSAMRWAALPIIRASLERDGDVYRCRIAIDNRLNEDLRIPEARVRGTFVRREMEPIGDTGKFERKEVTYPRSVPLSVEVLAGGSRSFTLLLSGDEARLRRSIRIKVSSSHRTLRSTWISIDPK